MGLQGLERTFVSTGPKTTKAEKITAIQTQRIELVESGDDMSPIGSDQEFEINEQQSRNA